MISAIFASQNGAAVTIIEKNQSPGKKLLLTGGGRCNLTHKGTIDDFVKAYGKSGRFLRHCLHEFSPQNTLDFFAEIGINTKADEEGCVFPLTERSDDVLNVLVEQCNQLNVQFKYGREVDKIEKHGSDFVAFANAEVLHAKKVIIAAGGLSYPSTGSTGDGFRLAKSLGHTIIEPKPALVPLVSNEKYCAELAGISRDKVIISAVINNKKVSEPGPMIFTHDGISGPAVLNLSRLLVDYLPAQNPLEILIDFVPDMNEARLEEYFIKQLSQYSRKIITNVLFELVPKKLGNLICGMAEITEENASQLKKEQRRKIIQLLKKFPLPITGTRPIEEAIITSGGVSTAAIDPLTMQSKICPGLYFAGEVIDVDGPCGGYNLQICWSTGALAGKL